MAGDLVDKYAGDSGRHGKRRMKVNYCKDTGAT